MTISLTWIGFGCEGIGRNSIAGWLQAKYGTPYLFRLLQSIAARGEIAYRKLWSIITVSAYKIIRLWTNCPNDHISEVEVSKAKKTHMDNIIVGIYALPIFGIIIMIFTYLYCNWHPQRRVIEIIARNPNGTYSCPECNQEFSPQ